MAPAAAPVTVTVCAVAQFDIVNTNTAGSTVATVVSSLATLIVTSPVGAAAKATV